MTIHSKISSYFKNQINEIESDSVLVWFGALLSFILVLTGIFFLGRIPISFLEQHQEAICWPFWPTCQQAHIFPLMGNQILLSVFTLFSIALTAMFCFRRNLKLAYFMLIIMNILKMGIVALDYRYRLNQHIMSFWITVLFLFVPKKRNSILWMIPLFYFWAGIIKCNEEWLSGAALMGKLPFFHGWALVASCVYVVILELVLIWGLLLPGTWIAWATWAQLLIFHFISYFVVGFYYPWLMLSLLLFFPLCWSRKLSPTQSFERPKISTWIAIGIFSFLQILPKFYPGNTNLTGEGRLFSLHMIDSRTECEAKLVVHHANNSVEIKNLRMRLPVRIQCDPIVYLSRAKNICNHPHPADDQMDLLLMSKISTDSTFQKTVDLKDFCHQDVKYSLFFHNPWISPSN